MKQLEYLEDYLASILSLGKIIRESRTYLKEDGVYLKLGGESELNALRGKLHDISQGESHLKQDTPQLAKLAAIKYLEYQKLVLEAELAELKGE